MSEIKNEAKSEDKKITLETVIAGLKFIAENPALSQDKLVDGLLDLGCDFSVNDIKKQFSRNFNIDSIEFYEGMKETDIACGAYVIAITRDSEFDRVRCVNRFFFVDDSTSVYHFIRVASRKIKFNKFLAFF